MTQPLDLTSPGPLIPAQRHHAWLLESRELLRLAVPLAATFGGLAVAVYTVYRSLRRANAADDAQQGRPSDSRRTRSPVR